MRSTTHYRLTYFILTLITLLMLAGVLPRVVILGVAGVYCVLMIAYPFRRALMVFLSSIPLMVALPLTTSYDALTLWRVLAIILTVRVVWIKAYRIQLIQHIQLLLHKPRSWLRQNTRTWVLGVLLVLSMVSVIVAEDPISAIKRIVYFVNLSLVPTLIYAALRNGELTLNDIQKSLVPSAILVIFVGFAQLASTYLMDIYGFMRYWGEGVQLRLFGTQWSYTAIHLGNTWFAYYGNQLSLRMFSLFPDSHSFPTFVLLSLPALLVYGYGPILTQAKAITLRSLYRTRASLKIIWVPLAFLAIITSGTRGIWLSSIGVAVLAVLLARWFAVRSVERYRRTLFSYTASYLSVFFLLFAVAWPIFISPQFLVGKLDQDLFRHRISSVLDFGETSNALRIEIWKSSLLSISQHPIMGVGIGNFPIVLHQRIELAKAGSTAHNLYLHVAAELGIPALLLTLWLFVDSWRVAYRWFLKSEQSALVYSSTLLLVMPWIYAYVVTDPILFDERVFLLFATTLAIIWAHDTRD